MSRQDRFIKACHKEQVDCTPVWLMRQAGRYMPEYRAIREKYTILEMIKNPELSCEVTLQPLNAFDIDAGIIFADILPLLEAMGLDLEFVKGEGPVIHNPIRNHIDIDSLAVTPSEETLKFTIDAIALTCKELAGKVPLIGFSGAPFTLASYAIEGGASKSYLYTKNLMYTEPLWWQKLMDKLSAQISDYLIAQINAGAKAIQIFDSWVGSLSPYDFRDYVLPHLQKIVKHIKEAHPELPVIYFSTSTGSYLPLIKEIGADVISVDWRIDILEAWEKLDNEPAIQGNLEPSLLLGPVETMHQQTARLLDAVGSRPGHIMNLGHGIHKETNPDNIASFVNFVHEHSKRD